MALLCLLSLTTSCANEVLVRTEYVPVEIPSSMLQDCPGVAWTGGDYRDLGKLAVARGAALDACNLRLQKLREYQKRILKNPDSAVEE